MSLLAKTRVATLAFIIILSGRAFTSAAESSSQTKVSSADTQAFVNTAFQKGKESYDAGRYTDALKAWETIDPYLDENPSVKKIVVFLRKQIQKKGIEVPQAKVTSKSRASSGSDEVQQEVVSTAIPQEVISQASQELASKAQEASQKQSELSSAAAGRQKDINDAFQKGKTAYEEGRIEAAIREWDKLSGEPGLAEPIRQLKANYAELGRQNAQLKSVSSAAELPEDLTSFLNKAGQRFQAEALQLSARTKETQSRSTHDQEQLRDIFEKSNLLYAQGKYNQAIEEWKQVLPIAGENSELGRQILTLEANYEAMLQAKQAADEVEKSYRDDSALENYTLQISKVGQELAKKAQDAKQKRIQTETASTQRRQLVSEAFENGRRAYEEGRTEEAMTEWEKLSTEPITGCY